MKEEKSTRESEKKKNKEIGNPEDFMKIQLATES